MLETAVSSSAHLVLPLVCAYSLPRISVFVVRIKEAVSAGKSGEKQMIDGPSSTAGGQRFSSRQDDDLVLTYSSLLCRRLWLPAARSNTEQRGWSRLKAKPVEAHILRVSTCSRHRASDLKGDTVVELPWV